MSYFSLFISLILVPLFNAYRTKKQQKGSASKETGYLLMQIIYWAQFVLIGLSMPISDLYRPEYAISAVAAILLWCLVAHVIITTILPLVLLSFNQRIREIVQSSYDSSLYPVTDRQQLLFALATVTVGICEELIFRGFLYNFLIEEFSLTATLSFIIASLIFGLLHFMQGVRGITNSIAFGLIMGFLASLSGSLLLPIIVHIIYNLKAIYIARTLGPQIKRAD